MTIRRAADPICVLNIWDAIRSLGLENQPAELKSVIKYLQSIFYTSTQAESIIKQSKEDGLVVTLSKTVENNETIEILGIPTCEKPILDGKDWYCFECHLAGDVTECQNCYRVYHTDCIPQSRRRYEEFKKANFTIKPSTPSGGGGGYGGSCNQQTQQLLKENNIILQKDQNLNNSQNISSNTNIDDDNKNSNILNDNNSSYRTTLNNNINNGASSDIGFNNSLCCICNFSQLNSHSCLVKSELNYLLKFVIIRIQSWLPNNITHKMGEDQRPAWLTDDELMWRANQLFFAHSDMALIHDKLTNEQYTHIYEFLADVLTIQHNVAIFHGIESQEYGASELMERDCIHDLSEMNNCVDCYKHSNEKINAKWFCLPCRVPHRLVWAKQKGYPYWPAKIIRETQTHFDVRFFGGKYERSLLHKSSVKPIETPKEKLQIKPSTAFNKAVDEMKYHQKLLDNPVELQKLLQSSSKPKTSRLSIKMKPPNPKSLPSTTKSSPATTETMKRKNSLTTITNPIVESLNTSSTTTTTTVLNTTNINPLPQCNNTPILIDSLKRKNSFEGNPVNKRLTCDNNLQNSDVIPPITSDNIISLSSEGEEDHSEYSFRTNYSVETADFNGSYDQVSSSTENYKNSNSISEVQSNGMQKLDHPYSDSVERMRRKLECLSDKNDVIRCAMDCMQHEIDRITNAHNEHLKKLFETHKAQISETKKKQWCYNCEQDAIYHCCWNTAYCSQTCQQQHWQAEHKKVCRRKR